MPTGNNEREMNGGLNKITTKEAGEYKLQPHIYALTRVINSTLEIF